jgi:hypothetical protein
MDFRRSTPVQFRSLAELAFDTRRVLSQGCLSGGQKIQNGRRCEIIRMIEDRCGNPSAMASR